LAVDSSIVIVVDTIIIVKIILFLLKMALLGVAENKYPLIQQTALLGSAHIFRKMLSITA